MSVSPTSLLAYSSIKDKLGDKQQTVYEAIKELNRASNEQIAEYLGWEINRVTGRCTELRNYGLITVDGVTKNKSGASAKVWVVKDLNDEKLKQYTVSEPTHYAAVSWLNDTVECAA